MYSWLHMNAYHIASPATSWLHMTAYECAHSCISRSQSGYFMATYGKQMGAYAGGMGWLHMGALMATYGCTHGRI